MSTSVRASLLTAIAIIVQAGPASAAWLESSATLRAGYDSNVAAVNPIAGGIPHLEDEFFSSGVTLAADLKAAGLVSGPWATLKLSYAGEAVRYSEADEENYLSHRLSFSGKWQRGQDTITAELSVLRINGSKNTYVSSSATNAYGIALWRERRSQWQHRGRVQWTHQDASGAWRGTVNLLRYDLGTRFSGPCVSFVDRWDQSVSVERGFRQGPGTWWLGGQAGRQHQDALPLPGGEFDYSNNYRRLILGWSGKLGSKVKVNLAGGPDWRDFDGRVNTATFGDRKRQTWWVESDAAVELAPGWTLTGKVTRNTWVTSTGKSAYTDIAMDAGVAWKPNAQLQLRLGGRLLQSKYFPAARDDWMGSVVAGLEGSPTAHLRYGLDLTWQEAWSELQPVVGRDFHRTVLAARTTWVF